MKTKEPILCYVYDCWAYFTTQSLDKQWGDDWDDAPYEHNAGRPYYPYKEKGEDWDIIRVAWEGPFDTPDMYHANSPWSVKTINQGAVPWLTNVRNLYGNHTEPISIFAGCTLDYFKKEVRRGGGDVYVKEV